MRREATRFVVGGGVNTLLSYAIYWILLEWWPYPVAYTISYACGVVSGFAINTYFVFGTRWSWRKLAAFPLVHLANYLAGLAVVWASVRFLGVHERWAALVATAAVLPLNFLLTRLLIKGRLTTTQR